MRRVTTSPFRRIVDFMAVLSCFSQIVAGQDLIGLGCFWGEVVNHSPPLSAPSGGYFIVGVIWGRVVTCGVEYS